MPLRLHYYKIGGSGGGIAHKLWMPLRLHYYKIYNSHIQQPTGCFFLLLIFKLHIKSETKFFEERRKVNM